LSTATARASRHVGLLAEAARQRINRKARCTEVIKKATEKHDKQLDRMQQKVCSAEVKLAEERAALARTGECLCCRNEPGFDRTSVRPSTPRSSSG
jgi:hypothetical protein